MFFQKPILVLIALYIWGPAYAKDSFVGFPADRERRVAWFEFHLPASFTDRKFEGQLPFEEVHGNARSGYTAMFGWEPLSKVIKEKDGPLARTLKSIGINVGWFYLNGHKLPLNPEETYIRQLYTSGVNIGMYVPIELGRKLAFELGVDRRKTWVDKIDEGTRDDGKYSRLEENFNDASTSLRVKASVYLNRNFSLGAIGYKSVSGHDFKAITGGLTARFGTRTRRY